jgi:hypothetical protein
VAVIFNEIPPSLVANPEALELLVLCTKPSVAVAPDLLDASFDGEPCQVEGSETVDHVAVRAPRKWAPELKWLTRKRTKYATEQRYACLGGGANGACVGSQVEPS